MFSIDQTMMLLGDAKLMGEEIVKSLGHCGAVPHPNPSKPNPPKPARAELVEAPLFLDVARGGPK